MSFVNYFTVDEDFLFDELDTERMTGTLEPTPDELFDWALECEDRAVDHSGRRPSWAGRHRPVSPIGHSTWSFKAGPDPVLSSSRQARVSGPATSSDRKAA